MYYRVGGLPGISLCMRPWQGVGAILFYHRVLPREIVLADKGPNRFLAISEESFDAQIRHLSRNYEVISMDEMVLRSRKKKSHFGVAVTFDDGYKDNYQFAYPILKNHKIPATLYMTTRFLAGDTHLWWFELWDRIGETTQLCLNWNNERLEWDTSTLSGKHQCFEAVRELMLKTGTKGQEQILKQISKGESLRQYPGLCLSSDDLVAMDKDGLVSIGSHTHTHFSLASLSESELVYEMDRSKKILESLLKKPVRHLAYPFGAAKDAGPREASIAERLEHTTGVTTITGFVNRGSHPFSLPRIAVREHINAKKLGVLLSGFPALTGKAP